MYSFEGIENLWHGNTGPRVAGAWRAGQESSLSSRSASMAATVHSEFVFRPILWTIGIYKALATASMRSQQSPRPPEAFNFAKTIW